MPDGNVNSPGAAPQWAHASLGWVLVTFAPCMGTGCRRCPGGPWTAAGAGTQHPLGGWGRRGDRQWTGLLQLKPALHPAHVAGTCSALAVVLDL
jgi:hypothetical protein